jgi:hypothetical protein
MNLTPQGWHAKLTRFFRGVRCFAHFSGGRFADAAVMAAERSKPAAETTMRETDFTFPEIPVEDFKPDTETWTALYVVRQPRVQALPPVLEEEIPVRWHCGTLVAEVIKAERAEAEACRREIQHLTQHHQQRDARHRERVERLRERGDQWQARAERAEAELKRLRKSNLVRWLAKLGQW